MVLYLIIAGFNFTFHGARLASNSRGQNENTVLLVLTLIIAAIVGLIVVAFILVTERLANHLYPQDGGAWRRLAVPVLGSLITGFLLSRYFPEARGSGIPQTKAALFLRDGFISLRTVLGKFFLSATSLASGIALGREGPSVHVGAGVASVLGRRLGLSPGSVRALVPAGAAAALAAAFNTPIAAVLFAMEEVMGDMNAPVLGSIVVSSATSWIVLHLLLGDEPLFHVPAYQLVHPIEFAWYGVLGVLGGLVSVSFVKLLLWQRKHFLTLPAATRWIQPVAGALMVGGIGWFVPSVMGVGYNYVGQALNGQMLPGAMALLVLLRIITTATCYASGNAGGIFGPTLFIGAMLGGTVGGVAHNLLPDYTGSVGAYALVGMGAAFAGIVRVPLTSVIMVFEMTRDYSIIVPLMIANLVSYFISSRLQEEPIYEALQHQDGVHLPGGSRARAALLTVGNAFHPVTQVLNVFETISQAAASVDRTSEIWPVVDQKGLRGMLSRPELEAALQAGRADERLETLVPDPGTRDHLTIENFPHVHADHSLDEAMQRLSRQKIRVLPVVSRANVRELQGTVSLHDILAAYRVGTPQPDTTGGQKSQSMVPLIAVGAGLFLLIATLVSVNYVYRTTRNERAQQAYRTGTQLLRSARFDEAIEQLRAALSISPTRQNRLALGLALLEAGRLNESAAYLAEVTQEDPENGMANLGVARIAAKQGRLNDAIGLYRRAVQGKWPSPGANDLGMADQTDARIELVEALKQAGERSKAQAELLSLAAEAPRVPQVQKHVARMLAESGLASQAAAMYRDLVRANPLDYEALDGLGGSEMASGDFEAAQKAYSEALGIAPDNVVAEQQLQIADQVMSIDPELRDIKPAERYRRSIELLSREVNLAGRCAPDPVVLDEADKLVSTQHKPVSLSDSAEENISVAQKLWSAETAACSAKPPDPVLAAMMPALK